MSATGDWQPSLTSAYLATGTLKFEQTKAVRCSRAATTNALHNPSFFRIVRHLTGNVPGEGGLVTFPEA
jgi:hypothetical protein